MSHISIVVPTPHQRHLRKDAMTILRSLNMTTREPELPSTAAGQDTEQYLRRYGLYGTHRTLERFAVAMDGDTVVGVAHFFSNNLAISRLLNIGLIDGAQMMLNQANLAHLGVLEEYRNQGIGTSLIRATEHEAHSVGFKLLYGFAEGDAKRLHRFYTVNGFSTGGSGSDAPSEIYGDLAPCVAPTSRQGEYFWKKI